MQPKEKIEVQILKNDQVSTFFYRLKVSDPVNCAYDFDGIFCEECPREYKGNDDLYYKFLCTANPLYYPDEGYVPLIITGRHKKYRDITERWLRLNGIRFSQMIMRDFEIDPTDSGESIGNYKAKLYKMLYPTMFVESRFKQAKIIHQETGKDVFCPVGPVLLTKS